jgi:hypothetical protein
VRDIVSGAIMAATSVPQLIAYAETTGFSGYRGLTTAGPPYVAAALPWHMCPTRATDHAGTDSQNPFVHSVRSVIDFIVVIAWRRGVWSRDIRT